MKPNLQRKWQPRKWLPLSLIALATAFTTWVLWHPLFAAVLDGASPQSVIKDWGLGDQLSYLAISRNVADGASAYVEPFTETGSSIYPSTYYWLLGMFGNATNTTVLFAWNVVGIAMTVIACAMAATVAIQLTGRRWIGVVGVLTLLLGNLQWLINRDWMHVFKEHAVIWPAFVNLFNPAAEVVGMVLLLAALSMWLKASRTAELNRRYIALAGLFVGIGLNFHIYTTLFGVAVIAFVLLIWHLVSLPSRSAVIVSGACLVLASAAVACLQGSSPLMLLELLVVGAVAPILLVSQWRKHSLGAVFVFGITGLLGAVTSIVRIVRDVFSSESFMTYRAADAQGRSLSLPLENVVVYTLPLLAITLAAIVSLASQRNNPAKASWLASVVGVLIASGLLVFNSAWGMDQEPYRFYPYACFLLAVLVLPWLASSLTSRVHKMARMVLAALVVLLLGTVPSTVAFAKDVDVPVAGFSDQERQLYSEIAAQLPDGLALLDSCIPAHTFKIASGAKLADASVGLALPNRSVQLRRVKQSQIEGRLLSNSDLASAGITSIVLASHCKSIPQSDIAQRFGSALSVIDAKCGGGPEYSVYRVEPGRSPGLESIIENFSADSPLQPAVSPPEACGLEAPLIKPSPNYEK